MIQNNIAIILNRNVHQYSLRIRLTAIRISSSWSARQFELTRPDVFVFHETKFVSVCLSTV